MRKNIDRKLYDTATAQLVHTDETPAGCETLYRKRTGEYFLLDPDYQIAPLDYDAACEWASEHMPADAFAREFAANTDAPDGSVHASIMMPAAMYRKLEEESRRQGRSKSAIMCDAFAWMYRPATK